MITCIDGVEREDTPEQAEIRLTHSQAVKHPTKFHYHGLPYKTGSRPKGSPNTLTRQMRTALREAAEIIGRQHLAKNIDTLEVMHELNASMPDLNTELVAYWLALHDKEPRVLGTIMGRLMPLQITGLDGGPIRFTVDSPEDLIEKYRKLGVPINEWPAWLQRLENSKANEAKLIEAKVVDGNAP
jgi:hypothetical protein